MQTLGDPPTLRAQVRQWRSNGERIAFVPTMGNLHSGHLALVEQARRHAERIVASVFVNPMQFGPGEDFEAYPRTLAQDAEKLAAEGVDVLFAPDVETMYPGGDEQTTRVEVPALSQGLCNDFRPGHFTGVATVVARLFNLVQPDSAVFGEKDYQQLAVIRRMVRDLCWPIEVIGVATVREADGLALSSRNQYLSAAERSIAPLLYRTLSEVAESIRGQHTAYPGLEQLAVKMLEQAGFLPQYVSIRNAESLRPTALGDTHCVVLAAAYLGKARLIDNVCV